MPFTTILLDGGLDLNTPPILSPPGRLQDCQNFEVAYSTGYRRMDGYERFDGGFSPSDGMEVLDFGAPVSQFFSSRDAAYLSIRSTVQPVPGTGEVVGMFYLRDSLYAARDVIALALSSADTSLAAGDVVAAASWATGDPLPFYGTVLRVEPSDTGSQVVLYDTRGNAPVTGSLFRGTTNVATVSSVAASPGDLFANEPCRREF